ncbi:phosphotyrosine-specific Ptp2-like protein [Hortaea werneckii]|uniref:protein-tyrosine-phosphatase n=1 Tax=Hortaea werneckii TaxID=91943 RepID=A0A3M7G1V9_HORWE|nr:phosphotyrosine-specific Ptp2-like protein [Hortaea werneckii]RMY95119.1 hypothetical protein D0861_00909 [Hortaea werneckii]
MPETRSRQHPLSPTATARPSAPAMASYFSSSPRPDHLPTPHEKQHPLPKTPSPNYFGFQASAESNNDSPRHARGNWSPPSSTVRSTAAASPSVVPAEQNPDYDAFRRQSESGKTFSLGGLGGNFTMNAPPPGRQTQGRTASRTTPSEPTPKNDAKSKDMPPPHPTSRGSSSSSLDPSMAELSRSPKRLLSPGSVAELEPVRKGSPATFANGEHSERPEMRHERSSSYNQPRFHLPLDNINGPMAGTTAKQKAQTISSGAPSSSTQSSDESDQMVTPQHVVSLLQSKGEEILILDLRVSTQYAKSHVTGALNLCIPTTLLKRPSFNVQKLAETFSNEEQRSKFENWRKSSYIIVYDASSQYIKDAQICANTIKKFQSEGYDGSCLIIKGGFMEFNKSFSRYVEAGVDSQMSGSPQAEGGSEGPGIAPVIGGCPMPSSDKPANPFFGNIRQNMDLIGGVGQIPLMHPNASKQQEEEYPSWLRRAAEDKDQGKKVSTKFEAIERREKSRMEDALSGKVSYGVSTPQSQQSNQNKGGVQIAGIEKGTKNRYNNIWPFEHSRVKLQGVRKDGCDYFNANFVKASWSNKRYISTQAPIPATFNDFWNVVWQQDVRVIVMLTAEKEGAQVKAHNYWDDKRYGPLHLDFLSEKRASLEPARIHRSQQRRPKAMKRTSTSSAHPQVPLATIDPKEVFAASAADQPYVIVRKFLLRDERSPFEPMKEITQLQYSSWPDFGAPAHPAHLLGLVEQTDAVVRATEKSHTSQEPAAEGERPVVVHCSAGCGRTGTFCTVDSVIDMLKRQRLSKQQSAQGRQPTPMDVDEKSSGRLPGQHAKHDSKNDGSEDPLARHQSDGGFFASQYHHDAYENQGVEDAWVKSDEIDLVEKTVEDFRHQRLSMVQSLRQYVLCYESVMEWLTEQSPAEENSSKTRT